jgi:hypothetical protein
VRRRSRWPLTKMCTVAMRVARRFTRGAREPMQPPGCLAGQESRGSGVVGVRGFPPGGATGPGSGGRVAVESASVKRDLERLDHR